MKNRLLSMGIGISLLGWGCGGGTGGIDGSVIDQNAPKNPSALQAQGNTGSGIGLSWTPDTSVRIDAFVIQRDEDGAGFQDYATVNGDLSSFTDLQADAGKYYVYRVRADNGFGESEYSNDITVPEAPGTMWMELDVVDHGQVILHWNDHATVETSYTVERKLGSGAWTAVNQALGANESFYADGYNPSSGEAIYRVRACKLNGTYRGCSYSSAEISTNSVPQAPLVVGSPRCDFDGLYYWVSIDFNYLGSNEASISSFHVYRRNTLTVEPYAKIADVNPVRGGNNLFLMENATSGGTFAYRLRAFSSSNSLSDYSSEVSISCP